MRTHLLDRFPLSAGNHPTREDGLCAMEFVAWLAGEEHSDEPRCTCPVLAQAVRPLNDFLPDGLRDRLLRPLLPRLIGTRDGTRDGTATKQARALLALDQVLRILTPRLLRRSGQIAAAEFLENLPAMLDRKQVQIAATAIVEARLVLPRATAWMLSLADRGAAPEGFVAGLAHAARAVGTTWAFEQAAFTLARMATLRTPRPEQQAVLLRT